MAPLAVILGSTARTTPVTGACTGREKNPSARPMGSPRTTSWPGLTRAMAGLPMCWESGTIISGAKGKRRMARPAVSLWESGWIPRAKVLPLPNSPLNSIKMSPLHSSLGPQLNLAARCKSLAASGSFGFQGVPGCMQLAVHFSAALTMSLYEPP